MRQGLSRIFRKHSATAGMMQPGLPQNTARATTESSTSDIPMLYGQPPGTAQTVTEHSPNSHPIQSTLPTKSSLQSAVHKPPSTAHTPPKSSPQATQAQPRSHLTAALEEKTRRYPWFSDKFFRKLQSLTPHGANVQPTTKQPSTWKQASTTTPCMYRLR